jgi:hypothetical protein
MALSYLEGTSVEHACLRGASWPLLRVDSVMDHFLPLWLRGGGIRYNMKKKLEVKEALKALVGASR